MSNEKMYRVEKFLGVNQAIDGLRELKMGQAAKLINFAITDDSNLTVRPGIRQIPTPFPVSNLYPLALWSGFVGGTEYLIYVGAYEFDSILIFRSTDGGHELVTSASGTLGIGWEEDQTVKIFPYRGGVYIMSCYACVRFDGSSLEPASYYVPVVVTGAAPSGGGTTLENINLLTPLRKIQYSADGEALEYVLPEEALSVEAVTVDGVEDLTGSYDAQCHTYVFPIAPVKGVNNVCFTYKADPEATTATFAAIGAMRFSIPFSGSTDSQTFFYGDGTNLCYYSGIPAFGDTSGLYIPAMNEIAVNDTESAITAMVRHYSRLLVYKPDGVWAITYEPVTLENGNVIAGYYLRPVHSGTGNDAMGQVHLVNNYPRSFSCGGLYEWRITSTYYKDERYAKRISEPICKSLKAADVSRIVACDDNQHGTYYVFLNDKEGTILVHRTALDAWTVYQSPAAAEVLFAVMFGGTLYFAVPYRDLYYFDAAEKYDAPSGTPGAEKTPIAATYETGYMDFGADYLRKFSSEIWVSLLPENSSKLSITASTDRQSTYPEKALGANVFSWDAVDYARWSYNLSNAPKIRRIKLKVKKFVYYQLIFRVDEPGARATILGFDQLVRYGAKVK